MYKENGEKEEGTGTKGNSGIHQAATDIYEYCTHA